VSTARAINAVLAEEGARAERRIARVRILVFALLFIADLALILGGVDYSQGALVFTLSQDVLSLLIAFALALALQRRVPGWSRYAVLTLDTVWLAVTLTAMHRAGMVDPGRLSALAALGGGLLTCVSAMRFSTGATALAGAQAVALSLAAGRLLGAPAEHMIYDALILAVITAVCVWLSRRQRAALDLLATRRRLARFLPQQLVDQIATGALDARLGGRAANVSVLFTDIAGFSTMAERAEPQEVVAMLNQYLTAVVQVVFEQGGTLDKFVGDEVMAIFGAPVERGDDARRAVACALGIRAALRALNQERAEAGLGALRAGVGVHTGQVVAGNIGSPDRMEYTVIGDTVNVAARVEGLTRQLGADVLVTRATAEAAGEGFAFEPLGELPVKGRSEAVEVFSVADGLDAGSLKPGAP